MEILIQVSGLWDRYVGAAAIMLFSFAGTLIIHYFASGDYTELPFYELNKWIINKISPRGGRAK